MGKGNVPVGADRITNSLAITPETDGKCTSDWLEHPKPCRELLGFQTGYPRGRVFRGHTILTKASKSSVYGLQRQNNKCNKCLIKATLEHLKPATLLVPLSISGTNISFKRERS